MDGYYYSMRVKAGVAAELGEEARTAWKVTGIFIMTSGVLT